MVGSGYTMGREQDLKDVMGSKHNLLNFSPRCSTSCFLPGAFKMTELPCIEYPEGSIPWSLCSCPCRGINMRGDAGVCRCVVALSFCFQRLPRHWFGTGRHRTGLTETSALGEWWLQGWWASTCQLSPWRHHELSWELREQVSWRCLPTC